MDFHEITMKGKFIGPTGSTNPTSPAPVEGQIFYNNALSEKEYYFWNGTEWRKFSGKLQWIESDLTINVSSTLSNSELVSYSTLEAALEAFEEWMIWPGVTVRLKLNTGTHIISNKISIKNRFINEGDLVIDGAGATSIIKPVAGFVGDSLFYIENSEIKIKDCLIDGDSIIDEGVHGDFASHVIIENVSIQNCLKKGVFSYRGSYVVCYETIVDSCVNGYQVSENATLHCRGTRSTGNTYGYLATSNSFLSIYNDKNPLWYESDGDQNALTVQDASFCNLNNMTGTNYFVKFKNSSNSSIVCRYNSYTDARFAQITNNSGTYDLECTDNSCIRINSSTVKSLSKMSPYENIINNKNSLIYNDNTYSGNDWDYTTNKLCKTNYSSLTFPDFDQTQGVGIGSEAIKMEIINETYTPTRACDLKISFGFYVSLDINLNKSLRADLIIDGVLEKAYYLVRVYTDNVVASDTKAFTVFTFYVLENDNLDPKTIKIDAYLNDTLTEEGMTIGNIGNIIFEVEQL